MIDRMNGSIFAVQAFDCPNGLPGAWRARGAVGDLADRLGAIYDYWLDVSRRLAGASQVTLKRA